MTPPPEKAGDGGEGVGCRTAALSVLAVVALAAAAFAVGLALTLDPGCAGPCGRAGLALYAAGAPVSALFAVLAGGLPVAWPLDLILWIAAGALAVRLGERRRRPLWQAPLGLFALALAWGLVVSLLVERV